VFVFITRIIYRAVHCLETGAFCLACCGGGALFQMFSSLFVCRPNTHAFPVRDLFITRTHTIHCTNYTVTARPPGSSFDIATDQAPSFFWSPPSRPPKLAPTPETVRFRLESSGVCVCVCMCVYSMFRYDRLPRRVSDLLHFRGFPL